MLRAVDIAGGPFAELQGLPTDLRPVTSWPNRDEAWTDVAKGIRRAVEQIQASWKDKGKGEPVTAGLEGMGDDTGAYPTMDATHILSRSTPMTGTKTCRNLPSEPEQPKSFAPKDAKPDPILARVVDEFSAQVTEAAKARGAAGIDQAQAKRAALSLIDNPDQKRVLWVDDRPSNNVLETAALAKLQIEVVPVTDTEAALERIAKDPEAFDLVLSDWQRPERTEGAPSTGIHLLRALRARQLTMPVVFDHGSFSGRERRAGHEMALAEGAYGEAVMPDELLVLVAGSLGLH